MTAEQIGLAGLAQYPLARRGFVMTGLIAGLTLAATRVEAQAIHTSAEGLDAGETKIAVSDGALPAYFAKPTGAGPFPVVLVIEEIFGVHEYIKDICWPIWTPPPPGPRLTAARRSGWPSPGSAGAGATRGCMPRITPA